MNILSKCLSGPGINLPEERPSRSYNIPNIQSNYKKSILSFLAGVMLLLGGSVNAQRIMENLGRGVVATRTASNTVFINWRLMGTEPANLGFNLYRITGNAAAVQLNTSVLTAGTNWEDKTANLTADNSYYVRAVSNGTEQAPSASFTLPANTPIQPFFKVPIQNTPGYAAKFIWVGDLDGDGEYDFVFDKQPIDDASKTILLEAYTRFGQRLWQLDCGPNSVNKYNISPGSSTLDIGHGDNFTVYDMNNDGKAEVIVRTANGVKFGNGAVLSETDNNKQFISVLNGMTGAEIARAPVPTDFIGQGPLNGHMGIAYIDGINPSVIWEAKNRNADKSFNELIIAMTLKNGSLIQNWKWLRSANEGSYPDGHQIRIIDVDGDGKDEIIPMGHVVKSNGTSLYSFGPQNIFHGDRFFITDMDPNRPGLEYYCIQQDNPSGLAWVYADARTGQVLASQTLSEIRDLGRGLVLDLDPRYRGYELYTFVDGLYNVQGQKITTTLPDSYPNLRMWWDGDLLGENLDNCKFTKWDYQTSTEGRLYTARDVNQVGPKTPGFMGDILGDWREEVVYEAADHNSLVIFTTPFPTNTRIYTLPHNPGYRNCMNLKGYYQGNMVDYYLGDGMSAPPIPNIVLVGGQSSASVTLQENATGFCGVEGTIDSNHEGFTGAGFANGNTAIGAGINWKANFPATGTYTFKFRHANGKPANRPAKLLINGAVAVANIDMTTTDLWTNWAQVQVNVNVSSGIKDVRLEATTSQGLSNIDYVNITGTVSPAAADCGSSSSRMMTSETKVEEKADELSTYPNPSRGAFIVKAKGTFDYVIRDQAGNVLEKGKGANQWGVGAKLVQGVYVLEISSPDKILQTKLIKY